MKYFAINIFTPHDRSIIKYVECETVQQARNIAKEIAIEIAIENDEDIYFEVDCDYSLLDWYCDQCEFIIQPISEKTYLNILNSYQGGKIK